MMNDFRQYTNRRRTRSSNTVAYRQYGGSSSSFSRSSSSSSSTNSNTSQRALVNLDAENLKLPYILTIDTSAQQITGTVTAEDTEIKQINSDRTEFNLSPYLSVGTNTIKISAQYSPCSSEIKVQLLGLDTQIVQQTAGSGVLTYTLTIVVL